MCISLCKLNKLAELPSPNISKRPTGAQKRNIYKKSKRKKKLSKILYKLSKSTQLLICFNFDIIFDFSHFHWTVYVEVLKGQGQKENTNQVRNPQ